MGQNVRFMSDLGWMGSKVYHINLWDIVTWTIRVIITRDIKIFYIYLLVYFGV